MNKLKETKNNYESLSFINITNNKKYIYQDKFRKYFVLFQKRKVIKKKNDLIKIKSPPPQKKIIPHF